MYKERANIENNHKNHSLITVYLVMTLLTTGLLALAFALVPERIVPEISKSAFALLEVLPVAALSILATTLITSFIPADFIIKWAGNKSGMIGILIAAGTGAIIPCEPVLGLPMILGIARSGAGIGFIVALLTASKLFSFMRIPDYFTFLDFKLAIVLLACTLVMPYLSGLLAGFSANYIDWKLIQIRQQKTIQ